MVRLLECLRIELLAGSGFTICWRGIGKLVVASSRRYYILSRSKTKWALNSRNQVYKTAHQNHVTWQRSKSIAFFCIVFLRSLPFSFEYIYSCNEIFFPLMTQVVQDFLYAWVSSILEWSGAMQKLANGIRSINFKVRSLYTFPISTYNPIPSLVYFIYQYYSEGIS